MSEQKWFERDPLPRAVIDQDGDIWVYDINATITGAEYTYMSDKGWYFAEDLEDCFGPCTPLAPENGQAEPPSSDALTVPAGELKRALELRMGEHAKRIVDSYNYHPEDAVKAGDMARLALVIDPNTHTTWVLTPVKELKNDQTN